MLKRKHIKCVKNQANERLKKLREAIREEVKTSLKREQNHISTPIKQTIEPYKNHNNNAQKFKKNCNKISPTFSSNERLKKLRETMKEENQSTTPKHFHSPFRLESSNIKTNLKRRLTIEEDQKTKKPRLGDVEPMEWNISENCGVLIDNEIDLNIKNEDLKRNNSNIIVVTDTNIFLHKLQVIKDILDRKGDIEPIIYVPWIVLEELDFIKSNFQTSQNRSAKEAIKFINDSLNERNSRIIGQTLLEANDQADTDKSPDNKIITSCLQVQQNNAHVILLTDDLNLRNKALINKITSSSSRDILKKIKFRISKNQIILDKMTVLLWDVIKVCAKDAYGDVWNKMDLLKTNPHTLQDCIKIIQKYWKSIFSFKLLKQFQTTVQDLLDIVSKIAESENGSELFEQLVTICGRICLFLKDIKECRKEAEICIKEISNLKN